MDQNRRQFLKRSAIVGGAVWAAPAIATVSSALAATSTAPGCTTCKGQGDGAFASVLGSIITVGPLGLGTSQPDFCVASVSVPNVAGLTAVCGGFSASPSCTGDSHVAGQPISVLGPVLNATAISTTAHQSSTCANTGTTVLANASINGATAVNLTPAPNTPILAGLPAGVVSLTLNRQCCDASGNFTVRGVELILLGGVPLLQTVVVLAESKVGGCGCACTLPACAV